MTRANEIEPTTPSASEFLNPAVLSCPFDFFQRAHQQSPVVSLPELGVHIITRYEDVKRVLRDERVFSSSSGGRMGSGGMSISQPPPSVQEILAEGYPHVDTLPWLDAPQHTEQRAVVNSAFTPRRVKQLRDTIAEFAATALAAWPDSGVVDLIDTFAAPLPIVTLGKALGIDPKDNRRFRRWSTAILSRLGTVSTEEQEKIEARHVVDFQHFMADLIEARRREPGDDMLSDLINTPREHGEPLSTLELINLFMVIMVAGNSTTQSTIAVLMYELARRPETMKIVRERPETRPAAIEEALRLHSPVRVFSRFTTEEVEIGGMTIPAGQMVLPNFYAANVDAARFEDPHEFRLDRPRLSSSHLAFGFGAHYCSGASLARAEVEIALDALLDSFREIELPAGFEPQFDPNVWHTGLPELPLVVRR
jgi:cytochrome P450